MDEAQKGIDFMADRDGKLNEWRLDAGPAS